MDGKTGHAGITTLLYAVATFGLVPMSMAYEVAEPLLGDGILASSCYWTAGVVGLAGLARRCLLPL